MICDLQFAFSTIFVSFFESVGEPAWPVLPGFVQCCVTVCSGQKATTPCLCCFAARKICSRSATQLHKVRPPPAQPCTLLIYCAKDSWTQILLSNTYFWYLAADFTMSLFFWPPSSRNLQPRQYFSVVHPLFVRLSMRESLRQFLPLCSYAAAVYGPTPCLKMWCRFFAITSC